MTDTTTRPPTAPGVAAALSQLVGVDCSRFQQQYWGTRPKLTRAADLPGGALDLFSRDAVDELITVRGLRAPFLRVASGGRTFAESSFTSGGGVGAAVGDQVNDDRVWAHLRAGATLVLQGLHRTWEPILAFTLALAGDLGHPVQVNSYVTPAANTGFSAHYDVHDVFVVQVEGTKRWRLTEPVVAAPSRDDPWDRHRGEVARAAAGAPYLEVTLEPGDVLYLPRGWIHAATALGELSIHLTFGVHPWTRESLARDLMTAALARCIDDPQLRASLPIGADATDEVDVVRAALLAALSDLTPGEVTAAQTRRSRAAQRPGPLPPLRQLAAVDDIAQTMTGDLVLRAHADAHLVSGDEGLTLTSRFGAIEVPRVPEAEAAIGVLLDTGRVAAADLGPELVSRLIDAGLVTPR